MYVHAICAKAGAVLLHLTTGAGRGCECVAAGTPTNHNTKGGHEQPRSRRGKRPHQQPIQNNKAGESTRHNLSVNCYDYCGPATVLLVEEDGRQAAERYCSAYYTMRPKGAELCKASGRWVAPSKVYVKKRGQNATSQQNDQSQTAIIKAADL